MDKLVGQKNREGIYDVSGLGEYYRPFYTITEYLRLKNRISATEQSRAFIHGFQPTLLKEIMCRVELKFPDHFRDNPYPLEDVRAATEFVLQGTDSSVIQPSPVEKKSIAMKPEDLQTFMETFAKMIVNAIGNRSEPAQRQQVLFACSLVPRGNACHY